MRLQEITPTHTRATTYFSFKKKIFLLVIKLVSNLLRFYPCNKNYDQIKECFPFLLKALPGFFLCIFSSITWPAETLVSASGIFCGGTYLPASQALLGSSDQWKVPASLSLFLKSEKIPALLYLGKGPALPRFHRRACASFQALLQYRNHEQLIY
jgi:hypothetical protein